MSNRNVNKYIKQIRRCMKCPSKYKNKALSDFRDLIEDYDETPTLSLQELYEKFDPPDAVAKFYLEDVPQNKIIAFKIRAYLAKILIVLILLLLLIVGYIIAVRNNTTHVITEEASKDYTTRLEKENNYDLQSILP